MASKSKVIIKIEEDIRIFIHRQIDLFLQDEHQTELDFPATLTNLHRAYIHEYVKNKRLKSKSHGKGDGRYLSIYKMSIAAVTHEDTILKLAPETTDILFELQKGYKTAGTLESSSRKQNTTRTNSIFLTSVPPTVPPSLKALSDVLDDRKRLPISQFHDIILKCGLQNQVLIISGNTGSGKTTQVPQFIMEDAARKHAPCRIICTQPRRISAVTVAERVCVERNEKLGDTVGYQIRLESRLKRTTNLVFCTNGILLRCLMGKIASKFLKNITHIIIDEVHERDQYSDFLLIALKDNLSCHPHVKVILMSATIESNTFSNYFNNCPVIEIPGRLFPIQSFHLEDILFNIDIYNNTVKDVKRKLVANLEQQHSRTQMPAIANMDDETILLMNDILEVCWIENSPEGFHSFFALIDEEIGPIDFQHTETKMTALMIAAAKGHTEIVKKLLNMGANAFMKEKHNYTAYDWACFVHGNSSCSELLKSALHQSEPPFSRSLTANSTKVLLDAYHTSVGDEKIDHNLIVDVILYICRNQPEGGILVFLPGYEDIQEQFDLLMSRVSSLFHLKVFMLHSKMQTSDQHSVFKPVPQGVRKIILATNIAETSITMDDVVYVVDSGKVKQKYYDSLTSTTSLAATWISQACATQRAGRAGRTKPGKCFRLYSRTRLGAFDQFTLPEIMRVPLNEICLQAALITKDVSIHEFLNKAIQAPSATSIKQSIRYLQKVGALDDEESVTDLGYILAELPVDARLGKMLLYGILLKCYDPVLLIVSILSINDIFVIPSFAGDKEKAKKVRRELAEESFSDCFCFLRAYQRWKDLRSPGSQRDLCNRLFLSHSKLTMVDDLRNKLHAHLCSVGIVKRYGPGGMEDINEFSNNWSLVKGCLLVGLYPNVCYLEKYSKTMKTRFEKKIFIHPSSVLGEKTMKRAKDKKDSSIWLPSEWITFEEKYKSGRGSMIRCNTVVSSLLIAIFAGPLHLDESECLIECENTDSMKCKIAIDDWINLTVEAKYAKAVLHTRRLVHELFLKFIENPRTHQLSARDHAIIKCLGQILLHEDRALELTNSLETIVGANRRGGSKMQDVHWKAEGFRNNVHSYVTRK
ncbi:3'-5' RNA helicase YTHDC2-like [Anopheles ziemanni]|uniref:3'-5' RNA helicase YTHDC2-like n=1 Tax=Anopheles coustani TaxID=139045 RepID=UPI002659558E|nr:3'-5' RNA helicase YTHDC2-like [Anopheles coustani]XP_058168625.1 3'-5' RNA helicase YTHDC2-like [Anopheles ziemanni]